MRKVVGIVCVFLGCTASALTQAQFDEAVCFVTNRILFPGVADGSIVYNRLNGFQKWKGIPDEEYAEILVDVLESLHQDVLTGREIPGVRSRSEKKQFTWELGVRYLGRMQTITPAATNFLLRTVRNEYPHEIERAVDAYLQLMKFSPESLEEMDRLTAEVKSRPVDTQKRLLWAIGMSFLQMILSERSSPAVKKRITSYLDERIENNSLTAYCFMHMLCEAKPEFEFTPKWERCVRMIVDAPDRGECLREIYAAKLTELEKRRKEEKEKKKDGGGE